jgi:hypothetical protein
MEDDRETSRKTSRKTSRCLACQIESEYTLRPCMVGKCSECEHRTPYAYMRYCDFCAKKLDCCDTCGTSMTDHFAIGQKAEKNNNTRLELLMQQRDRQELEHINDQQLRHDYANQTMVLWGALAGLGVLSLSCYFMLG